MNTPNAICDETGEPVTPAATPSTTKTKPAPTPAPPPKGRGLAGRVVDAARRAIGAASVAVGPDESRFEAAAVLRSIVEPDAEELRRAITAWREFEQRVAIVTEAGRERRRQTLISEIHAARDAAEVLRLAAEASLAVDHSKSGELRMAVGFAARGVALDLFEAPVARILKRRAQVIAGLRAEAEALEQRLAEQAAKLRLAIVPTHLSEQVDAAEAVLDEFEAAWAGHVAELHRRAFSVGLVEGLLGRIA